MINSATRMKGALAVCAVSLVVLAAACGGSSSSDNSSTSTPPTSTTPSTSTPTTSSGGTVSAAAGKTVFTSTCASCHTLADAGTTGTVGPNLDDLKPDDALVVHQVTNGGGGMPAFGNQLSEDQIKSVALYVSSVAGKGGSGGATTGQSGGAP